MEHLFQKRGYFVDLRWSKAAFLTATQAAKPDSMAAMRRDRQAQWDADHIKTESTRFPIDLDAKLRKCCEDANVTRYTLINYLLRAWMAAWEVEHGQQASNL